MIGATTLVGLGALAIVALVIARALLRVGQVMQDSLDRVSAVLESNAVDPSLAIEQRFANLEEDVDRLPKKWDDIRKEAKGYYERSRHHVRRVKAELEERGFADPEIDHLDGQLRLLDGGTGEVEGVQPVRESVDAVPAAPSAPVTETYDDLLRRKFSAY